MTTENENQEKNGKSENTGATGVIINRSKVEVPALVGFKFGEAPTYDEVTRCIHCGLCLNQCPTYRETGNETESPRGRLYLMRNFALGNIEGTSDKLFEHLDLCLQCRACETACPSGVKYGHIVELTLNEIGKQREEAQQETRTQKALKWLVFRQLFPYPERLRWFGITTRLYQRTFLRGMVQQLGLLKNPLLKKIGLGQLADLEPMLPAISKPVFTSPANGKIAAIIPQKYRVGLFSGCIMSLAFAQVNEATARVLAYNGCQVVIPATQNCCGALNVHNGDRAYGKEMAKRNIVAFEQAEIEAPLDAIIINAAGCGSMLKEYAELLHDDPQWANRAAKFTQKVKDFSEFLASIEFNRQLGPLNQRVTYQDACHLLHAQRVQKPPRILLQAIPGLEFVEMLDSDKCCGSAGIYNVTHFDMSMQILDHKMENVAATNAEVLATTNPGCHAQLQYGVKRCGLNEARPANAPLQVKHLAEILDESYRNYRENS
jgi:glycolate oxidase iron-sulfur subunit